MNQVQRSQKKGKDFWGPPFWTTIHIIAATLRPENAESFETFLRVLVKLLACKECGKNLEKKLNAFPPGPYLRNNHDAFFYSYLIHDLANQQITQHHPETPKVSPPFDEIKAYYFNALGEECADCQI